MGTTTVIFDCPIGPWLVAAPAALVAVALAVALWRDARPLRGWRRRVLLAVFAVVALLLVGLLLSPKLVRTWTDPQKPRYEILVDGTRSMLTADHYDGPAGAWVESWHAAGPSDSSSAQSASSADPAPSSSAEKSAAVTRRDIARRVLDHDVPAWIAALKGQIDLTAQRFGSRLVGLPLGAGATPFDVDEEGYSTPLGEALEESLAAAGASAAPPRALVLLSDGAWNTGRDPTEVARAWGRQGIPIYVIGVGEANPPRDVAVLGLRGPAQAMLGDEVTLSAQVAAVGLEGVRTPLELLCDGQVIQRKEVAMPPSGRPLAVPFTWVPDAPGRRNFIVRVADQAGDKTSATRAAAMSLEVIERKIRVLLIDSEPRWEFRFIRNAFERDSAMQLTICLLRPGVGPISGPGYLKALPVDKKDLADFDLLILGDVSREQLPDAFMKEVATMVRQRGAALVVIAGHRSGYRSLIGTPLGDILPVTLEGATSGEGVSEPFNPELTQEGLTHLITRLASGSEANELVWSHLPPLHWSATVGGAAHGASVLLAHPFRLAGASKMPLLAVQRVGEGKVMFSGLEETWRWRQSIGDTYHYRFWAQAARWLVKRQFAEGDPRVRLSVDRPECDVGEPVEIEAYCLGPDGFPVSDAQVAVHLTTADGGQAQDLALAPAPGGWGVYRATFRPTSPGQYRLQPVMSIYGPKPLESTATVKVERLDLEKYSLAQDVNSLKAIAAASGGRYLTVAELAEVPGLLAAKAEARTIRAEYSPCRHWSYYVLLAVLLGVGWLIRKRSGLA